MITKQAVEEIIMGALQNANDELDEGSKIDFGPETCLFGANAVLDSLSLVSLIVDVEQAVSAAAGRQVCLTDDAAMSQKVSPFTNVNTLSNYIVSLLS